MLMLGFIFKESRDLKFSFFLWNATYPCLRKI